MYIYIKVDTNDADFIGKFSEISEEDLEIIKPLIAAIKEFKPYTGLSKHYHSSWTHHHNYPYGEVWRPDLGEKSVRELYPNIEESVFDLFEEYCPYGEYGFHTIKDILIIEGKATKLI